MKSPVSMCLITRDEPLLEEALLSVRDHVQELVVVVTSTSDPAGFHTARAIADVVKVFEGCNDENGEIADFSAARNYAFSLTSFDWKLWMDADDIVDLSRLPEVLEFYQALRKTTGQDLLVSFPYEYSVDGQGVCNLIVPRERLVSGALARWVGEIHETIPTPPWGQPHTGSPENPDQRIVWKHQRYKSDAKRAAMGLPASNGTKRNIRILRRVYERDPGNLRSLFYLGWALCDSGDFEGVTRLEEYVSKTLVEDEKMMALLHMVKATLAKGMFDDAIRWGLQAVACKEKWSEGYLALGRVYRERAPVTKDRRDWEKCVHFTEIGLSVPPTKTFLFFDPTERSYWAHERMNYARAMIGDTRGALESARRGLAAKPGDTNLQLNVLVYEEQLARADAKAAVGKMKTAALELARRFEFPRASEDAYGRVETMIEDPRQADALVNLGGRGGQRPGEDGQDGQGVSGGKGGKCGAGEPQRSGLDIVFALGDCWEVWTPDTADRTGIGGSETAVIEMAKRLAAKGHRVRVFTSTVPWIYSGVEYCETKELGAVGRCDVLVVWRNAWILDSFARIQARVKLLWVHDVFAVGATRENLAKADKVLALSAWHRNFLAQYHTQHGLTLDKIFQTRNGIDLYKFDVYQGDNAVARNPFKCVYSSSADRGLEQLLEMWPRIRAEVPLATLDIFYGFSNWEKMAQNDRESLTRINRLKGAINALSGAGVVLRGRVNQLTLAKEFLSAGVWLYPTAFTETSCCHPDTKISVPGDHRGGPPTVRIADLVGKSGFPVYAFNEAENRFQLATCNRVWQTKIAEELMEIELDDGQLLRLTPEHLVLTFDFDWVRADSLVVGSSLRALHYRYNVAIRDGNGRWTNEHRLVGEWKEGRTLRRDEHVDHSDPIRLDNRPESLTVMSAREHGSKTHAGNKRSRRAYAKQVESFKKWIRSYEGKLYAKVSGARLGKSLWDRVAAMSQDERAAWEKRRAERRTATIAAKKLVDPAYAKHIHEMSVRAGKLGREAASKRMREDPAFAEATREKMRNAALALAALEAQDPARKAARYKKAGERSTEVCAQKRADAAWRDQELERLSAARAGKNHSVVAVRRIPGGPVFDMEVEGLHNFVADGVVVHNCLTAMEAQAAGLRIVTSPIAALVETVGPRGVMIEGHNESRSYQDAFVRAAVAVLRVPEEELARSPMAHLGRDVLQKYARENFSWDGVVEQWERELFPKVEVEVHLSFGGDISLGDPPLPRVAAPLRWSPSDPKPTPAPAKPKIRIDVVLSETASGGQPIDPENYLAVSHGGGSGRGCLGLVHALRKRGDYEVRAFAKFSRGMSGFYPLDTYDRLSTDRDVVFAFYDTSPLRDVEHGLRIASHHTYVPPDIWFSSFTDVNTAPTAHAVGRLRDGFDPHGNWEILPNGVHNPGTTWKPGPGRVLHHVSPDRGAHLLLPSWPAIRREVPGATLHMIGDVWGASRNNHPLGAAFARTVVGKRILALREGMREAEGAGGVMFMGHLPREALVRELSGASCFAYPCSVSMPCETFSVSTMECLMAGVPVVLSPADALGFYGDAVEMVREPAEEHMGEFVEAVVRVLRSTDLQQHLSMKGKKFAEGFTHDNMATALDRIVRKYL